MQKLDATSQHPKFQRPFAEMCLPTIGWAPPAPAMRTASRTFIVVSGGEESSLCGVGRAGVWNSAYMSKLRAAAGQGILRSRDGKPILPCDCLL